MLKKICFSLLLLTVVTPVLAQTSTQTLQTLMTNKGKMLFADDLGKISSDWKFPKGNWVIVDGALQGTERAKDNHGAVYRHDLIFNDATLSVQFKLDSAKVISFSINDATGHLARVVLQPTGFQARKDDHDHGGPDKAAAFNSVKMSLERNTWYELLIEMKGSEMLARVVEVANTSGKTIQASLGEHTALAGAKANIGLTVTGGSAEFRKLAIYSALENSNWADSKKTLESLIKPRG
jgi:hypothetical protein